MKKEEFVKALATAKIDPEVKKIAELLGPVDQALAELKKDEPVNLVASKLSHSLSCYLLGHELQAPECILELMPLVEKAANQYKGHAATAIMLGSLFGGH